MIKVDAAALRDLLSSTVTGGRNDPDGYRYALFSANGGVLRVTTTDSQTTVAMKIPADGDLGAIGIETAPLRGLLNGMAGTVSIKPAEKRCTVLCGASRYNVNTIPANDFPDIEHLEATPVEFSPLAFKEAIENVKYAAGKNDARYYFNGIHVLQNQVVATNGVQLAMAPVPAALGDEQSVIIPTAALPHILARLNESATFELMGGKVGVSSARFGTDNNSVTVALIAGKSPDFSRATHHGDEFTVQFDAGDIGPRVSRISPFCQRGKVEFVTNDGRLFLRSSDSQAEEVAEGAEINGALDVTLTDGLLSGVLARANGATVTWQGQSAADATRPHLFTFDGRSDEHYLSPVAR